MSGGVRCHAARGDRTTRNGTRRATPEARLALVFGLARFACACIAARTSVGRAHARRIGRVVDAFAVRNARVAVELAVAPAYARAILRARHGSRRADARKADRAPTVAGLEFAVAVHPAFSGREPAARHAAVCAGAAGRSPLAGSTARTTLAGAASSTPFAGATCRTACASVASRAPLAGGTCRSARAARSDVACGTGRSTRSSAAAAASARSTDVHVAPGTSARCTARAALPAVGVKRSAGGFPPTRDADERDPDTRRNDPKPLRKKSHTTESIA